MIQLNDYLYDGDTVLWILRKYRNDLQANAKATRNEVDLIHSNFLLQIAELLEHNQFLTGQSQRLQELYHYIASEYPDLAFTFKGRIKSLIRAEAKFNAYVVEYVCDYYQEHEKFPTVAELRSHLNCFRDLIAYRIVISLPKRNVKKGVNREERELQYLYDIANDLPEFLEERGFSVELSGLNGDRCSSMLEESVRPYYRDYIVNNGTEGYRSLHITLFDNSARCYVELQLRTKEMDDQAEIGEANHFGYEKRQEAERVSRGAVPPRGKCVYFDEAYDRILALHNLDLSEIDVNMFSAINNQLINDGCGLYRGRLILPYEHLSRLQNDGK